MRVLYKEVPSRRFGVELEVSNDYPKHYIADCLKEYECLTKDKAVLITPGDKGWAESKGNCFWHVKYDSTCGPMGKYHDHGWEVASYVGQGANDAHHIAGAAAYLSYYGLETNQNCGLHIHVEIADFISRDVGAMFSRWLRVEPYLYHICRSSRHDNIYCRTLWSRYREKCLYYPSYASDLWSLMGPTDFSTHNNAEKKYALNTVGYAIGQFNNDHKRKTVELRIPECRLSEPHVRNWTLLFLNFVDSCDGAEYPKSAKVASTLKEILYYLGLGGRDNLIFCDSDLLGAKCWFLKKLSEARFDKISDEAKEHLEFISRI